jgi:FkbM family methyltransferase
MLAQDHSLNAMTPTDNANSIVKAVARRVLPLRVRRMILEAAAELEAWKNGRQLERLRRRMCALPLEDSHWERLLHYSVHINNGPSAFGQYKLIFNDLIYHFETPSPNPLVLDCGSNIGLSILYFKHIYPRARIIGFEPDPALFPYLQENIAANQLNDVQLIQAALSRVPGTLTFYSDGKAGSCLEQNRPEDIRENWIRYEVPCIRLRDYLNEPVDFLKMNIEGAEWEVLADCDDRLPLIRQMVIEYHHWEGLPRTLHNILELLHRHGFTYLINHFDYEVNAGLRPPFQLKRDSRYYLMVFARRLEEDRSPDAR